ncbi:MAG: DNA-binding protein, partial [Planctomycetes bacterium]|nr:DNA-binding protein [Planctomycetota bacterium]
MELVSTSKDFYILRLDPGEELRQEVEKFCKEQGINAAWVNALGSCKELELAYYNLEKKEYETKTFSERLEIVTAVGNIALKDGESLDKTQDLPFIHIHGTFSNSSMSVIGGHINRCIISATCEVSLWKSERAIRRKYDEFTGLHLMCSLNLNLCLAFSKQNTRRGGVSWESKR